MSLLILGDLFLQDDHYRRLAELVPHVMTEVDPESATIRKLLPQARYLFACNVPLDPYLDLLSRLDLVVLAETGIVLLDEAAARRAGVPFTNLPSYSAPAVVQYALRAILESQRPWDEVFSAQVTGPRDPKIGRGLEARRVGLVGFGEIGRQLASALEALGAEVVASTRHSFRHPTVRWCSLAELFAGCDVVVVCCQLNPSSREMISGPLLDSLPEGAVLVSISHRDAFAFPDLVEVLRRRPDLEAWLDVDPRPEDAALRELETVHLSPHLAFFTRETLSQRIHACIDRLEAFLAGRPWRMGAPRGEPLPVRAGDWEDLAAERILEIASGFYASSALFAALELGLFDRFGQGAKTAEKLAAELRLDRRRLHGLLLALASQGVVRAEGGAAFSLPRRFREVLCRDSPRYYGDTALVLKKAVQPAWAEAADSVREGRPVAQMQALRTGDEELALFLTAGSNSQSRMVAPRALELLSLPAGGTVLDLGCGSAAISRGLLAACPGGKAILVDSEEVLAVTRGQYLGSPELAAACELVAADYCSDAAFATPADLVLLSNVLHMEDDPRARQLLAKSLGALRPGGRVAVVGFFLPDPVEDAPLIAHFSLSCQLLTQGGRCRRAETVAQWLLELGCESAWMAHLTRYVDLVVGELGAAPASESLGDARG